MQLETNPLDKASILVLIHLGKIKSDELDGIIQGFEGIMQHVKTADKATISGDMDLQQIHGHKKRKLTASVIGFNKSLLDVSNPLFFLIHRICFSNVENCL